MDTAFYLMIIFVFLAAIITTFVRARARDCCLKDFHGFNVTIAAADGERASGRLAVYSSGIELFYLKPSTGTDGSEEFSYIIYADQLPNLKGIYRYHDQLSEGKKRERDAALQKSYHPTIFRRMVRSLKNAINTLRDAVLEALGLAIGRFKAPSPAYGVIAQEQTKITGVSKEVLTQIGKAYEPILERYIGKKIIVEVTQADAAASLPGILKDYSDKFIEVLDVAMYQEQSFEIPADFDNVEITAREGVCEVRNGTHGPLLIKSITVGDQEKELNAKVKAGALHTFDLNTDAKDKPLKLLIQRQRIVDIILPRGSAIVRHSGEEPAGGLP